jgi:hypothetical protein
MLHNAELVGIAGDDGTIVEGFRGQSGDVPMGCKLQLACLSCSLGAVNLNSLSAK